MNTLTVLILLQTGVLLLLLGKVVAIEKEMPVAEYKDQNTLVSDVFDVLPADAYSSESYSYPTEIQLRHIIREELRSHFDSQPEPGNQAKSATALSSTDTSEYHHRRELVVQQLDYHTSVGSISNADMQKLQGDIAKIDEAGRREMLGKLTRAMNSGELEGRL
jgi:hypothetical protein